MSGGRFLISLAELLKSEKIIKIQKLIQQNVDLGKVSIPKYDQRELSIKTSNLIKSCNQNLKISDDTAEVLSYVTGYISRRLKKCINCACCSLILELNTNQSSYFSSLDRGMLTAPSAILIKYVQNSFCALDYLQSKIRKSGLPAGVLARDILNKLATRWNYVISCDQHIKEITKLMNCTISNIFFNNLRKSVNEKRDLHKLKAFKKRQLKKSFDATNTITPLN